MSNSSNKSRKRTTASGATKTRTDPFIPARTAAASVTAKTQPAIPAPVTRASPPSGFRATVQHWWANPTVQRAWGFLSGPYPTLVSRAVVGIIFLLAGVTKATAIPAFQIEIAAYQMVPSALIAPMATLIPLLEILVAAFLLLGLRTKWAALGAAGLLLIFEIAVLSAMARHLAIDCGCFANVKIDTLKGLNDLRETVGWRKVFEDALYLGMCAHLFFVPTTLALDALTKQTQKR